MILRRAALFVAGLCLAFSVALAQEPPQEPLPEAPPTEPVATPAPESETDLAAEAPPAEPRLNPCKVQSPPDEEPLDRYRREIFDTICEAAAEFDGFFGSRRFDEEARWTHGRAGLQVVWHDFRRFDRRSPSPDASWLANDSVFTDLRPAARFRDLVSRLRDSP